MAEETVSPDIELVKDSLDFYDRNQEIYKKNLDDINYIRFKQASTEIEHNILYLYNENKEEIYKTKYEYIGIYEPTINVWTWAWAIPTLSKKNTNIIRKLLMYGTELDPSSYFLKSELITSRFRINNEIQLDIHCSIASYLSKKPVVFKLKHYKNVNIEDNLINIKSPEYASGDVEINDYSEIYLFLLDSNLFMKE